MAANKREKIEELRRQKELETAQRASELSSKELPVKPDTTDSADELIKNVSLASSPQVVKEEPTPEIVSEPNNKSEWSETVSEPKTSTPQEDSKEMIFTIKPIQKKEETRSFKRQVALKPSSVKAIDNYLAEHTELGLSFNELVNQLLDNWLSNVNR